ncbi:OLC1v1032505C1 [Oldenlandia corymbosa var. corymbosa]|uniref:OLC1v1032505C1 n=1 Tax=Oldenlandia corymbosa var. corymbosa TaxID=529605 RepID=A0AAV1CMY4_OLDCO|nr:OLC1v1032505C1 [Oldenlandia corymbosa var. corymbosa]
MISSEATGIHYFSPENNPSSNFNTLVPGNFPAAFQFNKFFPDYHPHLQIQSPLQLIHDYQFAPATTPVSSLSNNSGSTSDEADELQLNLIDERKQRRMISNRESARRSRMRKQRHLDELWSQVLRLRNENQNLMNKLNDVSDSHDKVLKENARLKEEASDLRQMLTNLQLGSPFHNNGCLGDLDEVPCNSALLRSESSTTTSQSGVTTTSLID